MSKLTLNFENDKQREDFVAWFSDAGGENDYWNFYDTHSKICPSHDLIFTNKVVTEINFKVIKEEE